MEQDIVERLRESAKCLVHTDRIDDIGVLEAARIEIEHLRAHKRGQTEDIITLGQNVGRLTVALERIVEICSEKYGSQYYDANRLKDAVVALARRALDPEPPPCP